MTSQLEIQKLLEPIPGPNPAGENLRYAEVYDQIKEARRADDPLSQGEWQTELKTADWKLTVDLCTQALLTQSKDLQIAVWLTEALLKQHGYQGLARGLELIHELLEKYWDQLYPLMDDNDLDFRAGPLMYLDEKMPDAIFRVAICDPHKTKGYSYYQWEESRAVGVDQGLDYEQKQKRQAMIAAGKITSENFSAAVNASPIRFYQAQLEQLEQCRINLTLLDNTVNERFATDPPGFSRMAQCLDNCRHLVEKLYHEKKKREVHFEDEIPALPENNAFPPDDGEAAMDATVSDLVVGPVQKSAISDMTLDEQVMWTQALGYLKKNNLKGALDHLLAAASVAPSIRAKNRYLLLLAKLCLQAERPDLAKPIAEQLYTLLETLQLAQWEHPAWIAEVIETLYRCLGSEEQAPSERSRELFEKLCTLNVTKAAAYRFG